MALPGAGDRSPIPQTTEQTVDIGQLKKPNKYHACKYRGYASTREWARAQVLKRLEAAGEITGLREQVTFELIPAQRDDAGRLIERACCYVADFCYTTRTGEAVVEDSKGVRTHEYIIKRKLMLYRHGIRIKEV